MTPSLANRVDANTLYLREMMQRLGITPEDAAREAENAALAAARRRCAACTQAEACGAWLSCDHSPSAPPSFCPNRDFLRQTRRTG